MQNVNQESSKFQLLKSFGLTGGVVLPYPFRGMGAWRNSTETQQSDHSPWSEPEVKNGRSNAKDGAPERLIWRDNYPEGSDHPVAPNRRLV